MTEILNRYFLIGVMLFTGSSSGLHAAETNRGKPIVAASPANIVSQTEWVTIIRQGLIKKLCAPGSIAIKCFQKMTVTECADQLRSDVQICSNYAKLPLKIDRRKMSSKIAFQLGDCAGTRFSNYNNSRLVESSECQAEGKLK